jgi:hypothetical protein
MGALKVLRLCSEEVGRSICMISSHWTILGRGFVLVPKLIRIYVGSSKTGGIFLLPMISQPKS